MSPCFCFERRRTISEKPMLRGITQIVPQLFFDSIETTQKNIRSASHLLPPQLHTLVCYNKDLNIDNLLNKERYPKG